MSKNKPYGFYQKNLHPRTSGSIFLIKFLHIFFNARKSCLTGKNGLVCPIKQVLFFFQMKSTETINNAPTMPRSGQWHINLNYVLLPLPLFSSIERKKST